MTSSNFKRLRVFEAGVIAVLFVALFLVWINKAFAELPIPYKFFRPPTKEKICVQVWWRTPERVSEICRGGQACWFKSKNGECDLIVATKPKDFNDEYALMILGHELYHALGAQHD